MKASRAEDYVARDREPVRGKLAAFAALVTSQLFRTVSGPGAGWVQVNRTERGIDVVVNEPPEVFRGAFWVSLVSPTAVKVGDGRVNGVRPVVEGRYLDGTTAPDGTKLDAAGVPEIALGTVRPVNGRSWIVLELSDAPESGALVEGDGSLSVRHVAGLTTATEGSLVNGDLSLQRWPIAVLRWSPDGSRPERVTQLVYFDQQWTWTGERGVWGPAA